MTEISFKIPAKIRGLPLIFEEMEHKYGESDDTVKILLPDADGWPETLPEFSLVPLSELEVTNTDIRIISITKRISPFDRLLVGPDLTKNNLPELAKTLRPFAFEARSLLQWRQVQSTQNPGKLLKNSEEFYALSQFSDRGVILPWWIDPGSLLQKGWRVHSLHPAEFTPKSGSGSWAVTIPTDSGFDGFQTIKAMHHPATVVISNAERKFQRDFDVKGLDLIGIFIERPLEDKYHLYICAGSKFDDSIHYFDYPCSALGNLFEQVKEQLEHFSDKNTGK